MGVYGDFIKIYPKPSSIYLRRTIGLRVDLELGEVAVSNPLRFGLPCM